MKRNQSERLGAYERYSDGKISRDEYLAIRDKLYGSEARALLRAENVTNEMLLFFISRVKVYSNLKFEYRGERDMYSTESRQLNRAARCSPRGTYFFSPCEARANPTFNQKDWRA